jgi:hypothetical protein
VLSCREEVTAAALFPPTPIRPRRGDLIIGPLSFPDGTRLSRESRVVLNGSYKIPPVLAPGATVMITIAPAARSYVTMSNPSSPPRGVVAATYHGCPDQWGFFPQSFSFSHGRVRGCVPMDIRIADRPHARRVTLSLFAGPCRAADLTRPQ